MKKSINFKIFIGLLFIFTMSFIGINYTIKIFIERNSEKIISNELVNLKSNLNLYIKQYFYIKYLSINEDNFIQYGNQIVNEIKNIEKVSIILYDTNGNIINNNDLNLPFNSNKTLNNALVGKDSYIISTYKKNTLVYFSYPLEINGQKLGVISIIKDYSNLTDDTYILRIIFLSTLFVFIITFIFCSVLFRKITIPIIKLSKVSNEIANGNLDTIVNITSKDEIGDLANNFSKMIHSLKEKISIIENDKSRLIELSNHRKVFFANVTHELKTPLTIIQGYAEMLKETNLNNREFFNISTDHIIAESKRLHDMVSKLINISIEDSIGTSNDFKKVNLSDILMNTCNSLNLKANRYNMEIKHDVEDNLFIYGSSSKLKEVFINIIDNSIKYGYTNSMISVTAYKLKEVIYISVEDQGIGVDDDKIKNIFEPFYMVDMKKPRSIDSCGLGLTIVESIINNHNGKIEIKSKKDIGTTVIIKLPYYNYLQD